MEELVYLKLGGSLITDKNNPLTPRPDVLERLSAEIAAARREIPELRLVLGHGSGSFGHSVARRYGTVHGVRTPEQWQGFAEVWQAARALNQIVVEALTRAGLPVIAFPPSATIVSENGLPVQWNREPLAAALRANLIPLVNGDVVFDTILGGTILSTEDVFRLYAGHFPPSRVLLAGIEAGVWADYPQRTRLVEHIRLDTFSQVAAAIGGSQAVDVTGGMAAKVQEMLSLIEAAPGTQVMIFSGLDPGAVQAALRGERTGTVLSA